MRYTFIYVNIAVSIQMNAAVGHVFKYKVVLANSTSVPLIALAGVTAINQEAMCSNSAGVSRLDTLPMAAWMAGTLVNIDIAISPQRNCTCTACCVATYIVVESDEVVSTVAIDGARIAQASVRVVGNCVIIT